MKCTEAHTHTHAHAGAPALPPPPQQPPPAPLLWPSSPAARAQCLLTREAPAGAKVIAAVRGWRVVFSGDTRPCAQVGARGCLIAQRGLKCCLSVPLRIQFLSNLMHDVAKYVEVAASICVTAGRTKTCALLLCSLMLSAYPLQTVEAARGCSLLIHEATFENDMADDARKKRHSTSGEALSIAEQVRIHARVRVRVCVCVNVCGSLNIKARNCH
eukprot:scaffold189405_cov22-Tisochrysis_lutea.AAC.3